MEFIENICFSWYESHSEVNAMSTRTQKVRGLGGGAFGNTFYDLLTLVFHPHILSVTVRLH